MTYFDPIIIYRNPVQSVYLVGSGQIRSAYLLFALNVKPLNMVQFCDSFPIRFFDFFPLSHPYTFSLVLLFLAYRLCTQYSFFDVSSHLTSPSIFCSFSPKCLSQNFPLPPFQGLFLFFKVHPRTHMLLRLNKLDHIRMWDRPNSGIPKDGFPKMQLEREPPLSFRSNIDAKLKKT